MLTHETLVSHSLELEVGPLIRLWHHGRRGVVVVGGAGSLGAREPLRWRRLDQPWLRLQPRPRLRLCRNPSTLWQRTQGKRYPNSIACTALAGGEKSGNEVNAAARHDEV